MEEKSDNKYVLKKSHIGALIDNRLGNFVKNIELNVIIADKKYRTVQLQWLSNLITSDEILTGGYTEDVFDCEDMCFYLRTKASLYSLYNKLDAPLAMGIILTKHHAFNFVIDNTKGLVLVDTTNFNSKKYCRNSNMFSEYLELNDDDNYLRLVMI